VSAARDMVRNRADILRDVRALHGLWKAGSLGGAAMPEDVHPALPADGERLARYFTFGMALNYQRDSYALWRACTAAFEDRETAWVFDPAAASAASIDDVGAALGKHRVALQPTRHPQIWRQNAAGLTEHGGGSVRALFERNGFDVSEVRAFVIQHRKQFPYLCGPKIVNYWLYVMSQYMAAYEDWPIANRAALSIAPDRHVIEASLRLGLIEAAAPAEVVAECWRLLLLKTEFDPIDVHTPLWLWGRGGFQPFAA
jgi:hypothetical protein